MAAVQLCCIALLQLLRYISSCVCMFSSWTHILSSNFLFPPVPAHSSHKPPTQPFPPPHFLRSPIIRTNVHMIVWIVCGNVALSLFSPFVSCCTQIYKWVLNDIVTKPPSAFIQPIPSLGSFHGWCHRNCLRDSSVRLLYLLYVVFCTLAVLFLFK